VVRTIVNSVKPGTFCKEFALKRLMDKGYIRFGKKPSCYTGLVGNNTGKGANPVQRADCSGGSLYQLQVLGFSEEITLLIERPIPVDKNAYPSFTQ